MPIDSRRLIQQQIRERKYLNKDFDAFRNDLEEYARIFFPNKIQDFSPNGFGGLLLELASYIGDVQSFYLDHQFGELNPETAVETQNLEKLLREAGVLIQGAAPAIVNVTFFVSIPVVNLGVSSTPDRTALPVIKAGTIVTANNGINFQLLDDIDFTITQSNGTPGVSYVDSNGVTKNTINYVIGDRDSSGRILNYIYSSSGNCLSSATVTENFTVNGFEPFKKCSLQNRDVTDIISVVDSNGNNYYEVDFLTQDTVFKSVKNRNSVSTSPTSQQYIDANLEILPAPYRFYRTTSLSTRQTSLIFGGGSGENLDTNLIPDPSQVAIPLYGKKTFSRFSIDPNYLLKTSTLGTIAPNVTLTVTYRAGGGANHNISARSISQVSTLIMEFPNNPTAAVASVVRNSIDADNYSSASGGADAPSIETLRLQVPSARNAQSRIVSKEDLLARVYSMPANFGRVYRASIRNNPNNSNSALLYLLCQNANNELIIAPDLLKKNLAVYLNQFRMISDAIDIMDGRVINIQISYQVNIDPTYNRQLILQTIQAKLYQYFDTANFQMDQPLFIDDIRNIIYNNLGVLAVREPVITNLHGTVGDRVYSNEVYDINSNSINNTILIPPPGGMFEIKYKSQDIIGTAI